jgi:hypothetical protein
MVENQHIVEIPRASSIGSAGSSFFPKTAVQGK